jgi:glycosyltransferase involved in cell wall biosynthesis
LLDDETIYRIGENARKRILSLYGFEKIAQQKTQLLKQLKLTSSSSKKFPFLHQEDIVPLAETNDTADLLSVIIPFFNLGKYVDESVHSILNSTYKKVEVIIINDGSTDFASIEKLQLLSKLKNVVVIDKPNTGVADTRNYGATIAMGEFLAFLDADDKVASDYYEKAIIALKKYRNVFFAGCWVKYFENSTLIWPAFSPQPPYALVHNPVNSSALVYKRAAFLTGGRNDAKTGYGIEDYESVVSMLAHGFNGIVLPETLFYYRVRSGSMIRNISVEQLLYANKYISEKHNQYYTKFAVPIINILNANGPGFLYDTPAIETKVSVKSGKESILFFRIKNFIKKNERLKKIVLTLKIKR